MRDSALSSGSDCEKGDIGVCFGLLPTGTKHRLWWAFKPGTFDWHAFKAVQQRAGPAEGGLFASLLREFPLFDTFDPTRHE